MSININIQYKSNKKSFKITANACLQCSFDEACDHFRIDSNDYALIHRKKYIELNCPFRLLNLNNNITLDVESLKDVSDRGISIPRTIPIKKIVASTNESKNENPIIPLVASPIPSSTAKMISDVKLNEQDIFDYYRQSFVDMPKKQLELLSKNNYDAVLKPLYILLIKYINNIISHPPCNAQQYDGNQWNKYYNIKCSNKLFVDVFLQRRVKVVTGGLECLYMLGFIPSVGNGSGLMDGGTIGTEEPRSLLTHDDMCRLVSEGNLNDVVLTIYSSYTSPYDTVLDMMHYVMLRERLVVLAEEAGIPLSDIPMYKNVNVVHTNAMNAPGNMKTLPSNGSTGILGEKAAAFFQSNNDVLSDTHPALPPTATSAPIAALSENQTENNAGGVEFNPYQSYKISTTSIDNCTANANNGVSDGSGNKVAANSSGVVNLKSRLERRNKHVIVSSNVDCNSQLEVYNAHSVIDQQVAALETKKLELLSVGWRNETEKHETRNNRCTHYTPPGLVRSDLQVEGDDDVNDSDLEMDSYQLTSAILKRFKMGNSKEKDELQTNAVRLLKQLKNETIYNRTLIQVKCPDGAVLSGYFHPYESVGAIYHWFYKCLVEELQNIISIPDPSGSGSGNAYASLFRLKFPYGHDYHANESLYKNRYFPGCIVHCMWNSNEIQSMLNCPLDDRAYINSQLYERPEKNHLPAGVLLKLHVGDVSFEQNTGSPSGALEDSDDSKHKTSSSNNSNSISLQTKKILKAKPKWMK